MAKAGIGYLELLRGNLPYRRLVLANVISLLGDWLDLIAITELVTELSKKPESPMTQATALAGVMVARFLPTFLLGPIAGNVADRYPRHQVMVWANAVSAACVLAFLWFLTPQGLPMIIVLMFLKMGAASFFIPANQASVPMVVPREHLQEANALGSTTWSLMAVVGAIAGAFVVDAIGARLALVVDALTFLVANFFLWKLALPPADPSMSAKRGFHDFVDGLRYIAGHREVVLPLFVKPLMGATGGALLYPLMAEHVWPEGFFGKSGLAFVNGMIYLAFGLGTLLGPLAMRRLGHADVPAMQRRLGPAFLVTSIFMIFFSLAGPFGLAFGHQVLSSLGRSVCWVYSTLLLQVLVPDRFRGRVFAVEFGLMTLSMTLLILLSQRAIDAHWLAGLLPGGMEGEVRALGVALSVIGLIGAVPYLLARPPQEPVSADSGAA
ncbi:MAG TPA: MFS transporter [bacterium]|nr:MFS transporter [bacterium]